ncbi:hypothetical protein BC937DRAFT_90202 [Endogone sp. FLAS-F59071]|nr:hypothetical protein BC937DRAFT_90202 [Endogone sp. FLAS-F59071]|eukprot:RUS22160.1 hypothetical protein BC937DRAFT_90202 [Endogone sp. FLAS-F59071]
MLINLVAHTRFVTRQTVESDVHVHLAGPATARLYEQIGQAMKIRGINLRISSLLRPMFEAAGVKDIKMDYRSVPVGWGPEDLGPQVKANLFTALPEFKNIVITALGTGEEEYDELVAEALNETGNEYKSYINMTSIVGKKPVKSVEGKR